MITAENIFCIALKEYTEMFKGLCKSEVELKKMDNLITDINSKLEPFYQSEIGKKYR